MCLKNHSVYSLYSQGRRDGWETDVVTQVEYEGAFHQGSNRGSRKKQQASRNITVSIIMPSLQMKTLKVE